MPFLAYQWLLTYSGWYVDLKSSVFTWIKLLVFQDFSSRGLGKYYIHQMASCLPSHVSVLPNDASLEYPGYACLLGNLLEAAGVALSERNCAFNMVMGFATFRNLF